jgi:transposase-like protein
LGICEEIERISSYLRATEPSCPNPACANHGVGIGQSKGRYYSKGPTPAGSHRYRCRACSKAFTVNTSKPAKNHHLPHEKSEGYGMFTFRVFFNP